MWTLHAEDASITELQFIETINSSRQLGACQSISQPEPAHMQANCTDHGALIFALSRFDHGFF